MFKYELQLIFSYIAKRTIQFFYYVWHIFFYLLTCAVTSSFSAISASKFGYHDRHLTLFLDLMVFNAVVSSVHEAYKLLEFVPIVSPTMSVPRAL
jgi:hypothetical protein